jgi:N-methylhydantoinase B
VVVRPVRPELDEYELDRPATDSLRAEIAAERAGGLEQGPEELAARYRAGEVDMLDMIRRHGVIVDWGTGQLLPGTTEQFRRTLHERSLGHWA